MASEGGHAPTGSEFIEHHLTNLQVCEADGEWVWNDAAGKLLGDQRRHDGLLAGSGVTFAEYSAHIVKNASKLSRASCRLLSRLVSISLTAALKTRCTAPAGWYRTAGADDRGLGVLHEHHGSSAGRSAAKTFL